MLLPGKGSKKWFAIWIGSFLINLLLILFSRFQLGEVLNLNMMIGFSIISVLSATIISLGYFGYDVIAGIAIASNTFGLTYMLYITSTNINDGWSDITSIIVLIFAIIIGNALGLILQALKLIYNKRPKDVKKKKKKKSRK